MTTFLKPLVASIFIVCLFSISALSSSNEGEEYSSCYVLAAVVSEGSCFNSNGTYGSEYSVYATAGFNGAVNYDRIVDIYITKGSDIVQAATVRIPAYANKSENLPIFNNASERYGSVTVQIAQVTNANGSTNRCQLRDTNPTVNNCYNSSSGGGETDHCLGEDEDGDGICDYSDPDFEDDDEGFFGGN